MTRLPPVRPRPAWDAAPAEEAAARARRAYEGLLRASELAAGAAGGGGRVVLSAEDVRGALADMHLLEPEDAALQGVAPPREFLPQRLGAADSDVDATDLVGSLASVLDYDRTASPFVGAKDDLQFR